jgi:hypothetical protein
MATFYKYETMPDIGDYVISKEVINGHEVRVTFNSGKKMIVCCANIDEIESIERDKKIDKIL